MNINPDCMVCAHRQDVITLVSKGKHPEQAIDISFMSVLLMMLVDMPLPVLIKKLCVPHKACLNTVYAQNMEERENEHK